MLDRFNTFTLNEFDYKDPDNFENVEKIDVSLTNMRKAVLIKIGKEEAELTKEEAVQIIAAIQKAVKLM